VNDVTVPDDAAERIRQFLADLAERKRSRGHPDVSYEALLLYGRSYQNRPRPKGLRKWAYKRCYLNTALVVADSLAQRPGGGGVGPLVYVEGFASTSRSEVEHAWAADRDGNVVDVTWKFDPSAGYFGIPFRFDCVRTLMRCGTMSPLLGWWNRDVLARDPSEWVHEWT